MMSRRPTTEQNIVILTNNLLEAVDLTEQIQERGIGNAVIMRSPVEAVQYMNGIDAPPLLTIFAVDQTNEDWMAVLRLMIELGCRILFIDGAPEQNENSTALLRPFTSEDVDVAFRQLGVWP